MHLISMQDRDATSLTYGCFDRRYWAWKLVDIPEATYQRNVWPLAWLLEHGKSSALKHADQLKRSIIAGLLYAKRIQNQDGSFNQAYPMERSYGATAFLLLPMLRAYRVVKPNLNREVSHSLEICFRRAADYLCKSREMHGWITNHLAGAVVSLFESYQSMHDRRYLEKSKEILKDILDNQSDEGWFPEYGGADPGYQTLCIYYLAQIYQRWPEERLEQKIILALDFLSYFVHPDGSFGGEYGSRRTQVYYPGGIALLAKKFPHAYAINEFMLKSLSSDKTITLNQIDMGNLAPLLSNYILTHDALQNLPKQTPIRLPFQRAELSKDFPQAGLLIRSNQNFYTIIGVSNGGVMRIYRKNPPGLLLNDCGYAGELKNNQWITSQSTNLQNQFNGSVNNIECTSQFTRMQRMVQTPAKFTLLRLLNLTIMRIRTFNEWVKRRMVKFFILSTRYVQLSLKRKIYLDENRIMISDQLSNPTLIELQQLICGGHFISIHMASAGYYPEAGGDEYPLIKVNKRQLNELNRKGELTITRKYLIK